MNNNKRESSLSTCSFQDADIAFFPFLFETVTENLFGVSPHVLEQNIIGIANLPPIVPNRILLKGNEGKTFCLKKRPLEFALINPAVLMSEDQMFDYWDSLLPRMRKDGFLTIWMFAPRDTCEFFFRECIKGGGMFYYHDPLVRYIDSHYFLLTLSNRLRSYHLTMNNILPAN